MKIEELRKAIINNIDLVEHYGVKNQFPVWVEELAELQKEICKWDRHYDKQEGDLTEEQYNALVGEIADVTVILDQIKYVLDLDDEEVMKHYAEKVERQQKRRQEGIE